MESGIFSIVQWNGKDLLLQAPDQLFVFLTRTELSRDFVKFEDRHLPTRKIEITENGKIDWIKTSEEIAEENTDRSRPGTSYPGSLVPE
jgi:hypothetical protein